MKTGTFKNGMAWASMGEGSKIALLIPGGPGNPAPGKGVGSKAPFKLLVGLIRSDFRLISVARPRNMPKGHTVADMAKDYADMIQAEFDGCVELIVGSSYGGIIAQYLAANHDSCFKHIVVHVAACDISPEGKNIDYAFAKEMSEGRPIAAGFEFSRGLFPETQFPWLMKWMMGLFVWLTSRNQHEFFESDMLIEGEAERQFNSREVLPKIRVPVLLIAGETDFYFPKELTLETQELIPNCSLQMYEGKGHVEAAFDARMCSDIQNFMGSSIDRH